MVFTLKRECWSSDTPHICQTGWRNNKIIEITSEVRFHFCWSIFVPLYRSIVLYVLHNGFGRRFIFAIISIQVFDDFFHSNFNTNWSHFIYNFNLPSSGSRGTGEHLEATWAQCGFNTFGFTAEFFPLFQAFLFLPDFVHCSAHSLWISAKLWMIWMLTFLRNVRWPMSRIVWICLKNWRKLLYFIQLSKGHSFRHSCSFVNIIF